jgi:hypothetical protein
MNEERLMQRLRAADPAPATNHPPDQALWSSIVAAPGDPRLVDNRRPHRWRSLGTRRLSLAAVVFALLAGGGTAGVISSGMFGHDRPTQLFRDNPVGRDVSPGSALWHQAVIPGTVRRAETISIADVGRLQLWVASARQHGICSALRLPGGAWAGLGASGIDEGGSVPGCHPTRQQINGDGRPVYVIDGFDYVEALVRGHDGRSWRVEYGTIDPRQGRAGHVRDALSGITAAVANGRWFAIVFPIRDPQAIPHWRLEALSTTGRVIAEEPSTT